MTHAGYEDLWREWHAALAGPRLHHVAFTVPESYHLLFLCDRLACAA